MGDQTSIVTPKVEYFEDSIFYKSEKNFNLKLKKKKVLSWNRHLIVVERFACPCEPEGCVVWSLVLLVGSLMAEWSQVRGQTKNGSKIFSE